MSTKWNKRVPRDWLTEWEREQDEKPFQGIVVDRPPCVPGIPYPYTVTRDTPALVLRQLLAQAENRE